MRRGLGPNQTCVACSGNADCPSGEQCDLSDGAGSCKTPPSCAAFPTPSGFGVNGDMPTSLYCDDTCNGTCTGCQAPDVCYCDVNCTSGQCVSGITPVSGCGRGALAWNVFLQPPDSLTDDVGAYAMAGGPRGHVAVSAFHTTHMPGGIAEVFVFDPCGTYTTGASHDYDSNGAADNLVAFDPQDGLLYAYEAPPPFGGWYSGFVAGPASVSVTADVLADCYSLPDVKIGTSLIGRDTAGDSFVAVYVSAISCATGTYDFGGGAVSGANLIEYGPTGAFVRQMPTPPGTLAIGALGDLFAASQVTGTMDYGCGPVGTASVTSTVLAKLDATGACLWSDALPAGTSFALDPLENVLLATTFTGTLSFGGAPLTSVGTSDLALAKLAPTGALLWSESFGGSGASVSGITALGATNTGGMALVVGINGAADFGCGAVSSSTGATTLFASFDATGAVVYSRVVQLASGALDPVVDGLGGITMAFPMGSRPPPMSPYNTTVESTLVSRFAP